MKELSLYRTNPIKMKNDTYITQAFVRITEVLGTYLAVEGSHYVLL